ncbi:transposable element Tc1 transposase [Trichonephila clavipes]|nr:transposable element Tc1 transposase [Trichonephila clavipes]
MIVWMNCQTKLRINHLTAVKSVTILEKAGQSITETATCLNISRQTVSKLWKQFQNDGTVVFWTRSETNDKTASEDRYLALTARRNRKATACQLSSELAAATELLHHGKQYTEGLTKRSLCQKAKGMCFTVFTEKEGSFNWCKNIKTGLNINGPMFSLLMSRGLV